MNPKLVKIDAAQPWDYVQTGVSRLSRGRRRYSRVEHIALVMYRYGPSGGLLRVVPICGAGRGRSDSADEYGTLCARCAAKMERGW